jgi:hypothetical protein
MAIICGMSVIGTFLAEIQAAVPPIKMAIAMSPKWWRPGQKKVAMIARSMAPPAQTIPLRAVTGELILFRPIIKSRAVRK